MESMNKVAASLRVMADSFVDASGAETDPSMKALKCMASLTGQRAEIMALGVDSDPINQMSLKLLEKKLENVQSECEKFLLQNST